jgi:plastocyanin
MRPLALLLAAVVVAGCGDREPAARAPDGRVTVELDDFFLEPQTIRARPGPTRFEVANAGRLAHNFRLRRGPGEPLKITTMLPGESGSARIDLERGDYRMVCTVANHEELGMTGTLIVRRRG